MRKAIALVAAGSVLMALAGSALAHHSWANFHWARQSNPFTVKLGDNVSSTWDANLATASGDWSTSGVLDTTIVSGNTNPTNCDPTSGHVEVCDASYGNTGWLGVAQIWLSGNHIVQGTVKVNDTYHNSPPYNTNSWRQFVMCQEVGHEFGLDHQDESFDNPNLGTCMDYTSNPDGPPGNLHPNQHDYDQLDKIYRHRDKWTSVGSSSPLNESPAVLPANPPPFSQASRANGSVYMDDLGNGRRLITFVLWTPFGE